MIYEYANYANKIICMSDHEIKGLCLVFYLVKILVVYDTRVVNLGTTTKLC